MVTSLQLAGLADSIRQDAITQLQKVCSEFNLSYTITEKTMTIVLPTYEEVELPIIAKIDGDDLQAPDSTGGD